MSTINEIDWSSVTDSSVEDFKLDNVIVTKKCTEDTDWSLVTDKIKEFSLNGLTLTGKCVKTYDGDSIKVVLLFPDKLNKYTIRLSGIDTCEIRALNENEKKFAQVVKAAITNKILNKLVTLKFYQHDKYGRNLADVYLDNEHINQWLIDNKYAVKYDGGKKPDWHQMLIDNNY